MPHLVVLYTPNLEAQADMTVLCRSLADSMLAARDEQDAPVFPIGGTRVLAYPAAHFAVADGRADYAFVYLNLRMAAGRSRETQQRVGESLLAAAQRHFSAVFATRLVGLTLQIDESPGQVYDGKLSNLHPLFNK